MQELEVAEEMRCAIGESPTWSAGDGCLYWIDVKAPALHRLRPDDGTVRSWRVDADLGAFALFPALDAALVALRTGLYRLDFATGRTTLLAPPPFDPATHRFNEGGCDPDGRFWVGVMFDPIDPGAEPAPGALHSRRRAARPARQR